MVSVVVVAVVPQVVVPQVAVVVAVVVFVPPFCFLQSNSRHFRTWCPLSANAPAIRPSSSMLPWFS